MARRSRHRDRDDYQDLLDDLSSTPVSRQTPTPAVVHRAPRISSGLSDLRRWDPAPEVARDSVGRPARIVHAPKRQSRLAAGVKPLRPKSTTSATWLPRASFRFETGATIPICAKRKIRRQVLHALKKTRSGKGSPKKRNRWSSISCGTS